MISSYGREFPWITIEKGKIISVLSPYITEKIKIRSYTRAEIPELKDLSLQKRPAGWILPKALYISNATSRISPHPLKNPTNSIRHNCQKICSRLRSETILEIKKGTTFLEVINKPIIYKFSKDFTNQRKKTNWAVILSCSPLPNILKYRGYRWNLPTI